ncbi:exported hypothetical protein [Syntrophobacter sp. SbD1]|nr:exported hypothetical protein [Syntrophobacter sp. SbD1]
MVRPKQPTRAKTSNRVVIALFMAFSFQAMSLVDSDFCSQDDATLTHHIEQHRCQAGNIAPVLYLADIYE